MTTISDDITENLDIILSSLSRQLNLGLLNMSVLSSCFEIDAFKKIIQAIYDNLLSTNSSIHVYLPLKCEDVQHTFITTEVLFKHDRLLHLIDIQVFYSVFHISKKKEFSISTTIPIETQTPDKIMEYLFSLYYKYKLCPECLKLIEDDQDLCTTCSFHKMRNNFAVENKWVERDSIGGNCCICCNPVYNTKLKCGHYLHHICVIQLSPFQWFNTDDSDMKKLKCPMCRTILTEYDINRYFRCK